MTFFVEVLSKHFEPQTQVKRIGEYKTREEAIAAAQGIIEDFLRRQFKPGMTAEALFALYHGHGEYPFIFRDDANTFNVPGFGHANHAMTYAAKLCGGKK